MHSYAQLLTTPTADTPGTTLVLHFDGKRYLIGSLAEGTQRASVQVGARLLRVSECFLTGRTEWSNTGGLIGMILTLADSSAASREGSIAEAKAQAKFKAKQQGILNDREKRRALEEEAISKVPQPRLQLFAPPNLNHTLATARRFVFRKGMPVDVHEVHDDRPTKEDEDEWAPYWADENIKVWAMSISPSSSTTAADNRTVSRQTTPRKRTIDEVYGQQPSANGDLTPQEHDQLTVKAVVSEMFDSSWRLDTLYETRLADVKSPATVFIRNQATGKVERYQGPLPNGERPLPDPDLTVLVRRPWPGALVSSLPPTKPAQEAISYIIRNHAQRGKFQPEAIKKLKVPRGEMWGQLAAGHSVQNEDGETITPDMVLGPGKEGGGLAVVDLPDPSYIDNLVNRPEWREQKVMAGVGVIFWICGKDVASDPRIHEFMRQHNHLEHVVSSSDYCPNNIAMNSSAASMIRLHKVDPLRYGIPVHDTESSEGHQAYGSAGAYVTARDRRPLPDGVHLATRGHTVRLEPSFEFKHTQLLPPFDVSAVESEMSQEVLEEAAKAQEAIKADEDKVSAWASDLPDKNAEVITLGTGSALPSKYRNVSATLLRVPGWGSVLFDCGENTLGQLKRVFTEEELKQVLQELRLIFISHMHADHHLGTVGVIKAWYQEVHGGKPGLSPTKYRNITSLIGEDEKRLTIISEPAMMEWLAEYSAVEDYGFSRLAPLHIQTAKPDKSVRSKLFWFTSPIELAGMTEQQQVDRVNRNHIPPSLIGLKDVQAVAVRHCHGARAASITFPSGFKASYSGDCRPSKSFSEIGKGSTVCIHEATFDDELQGDAESKNHSTTSEALGVAQAMDAKACVLTHFSQRYQKIPVLEHKEAGDGKDVSLDVPDTDPTEGGEAAMDAQMPVDDPENGPLEDATAMFPDQTTSNGKQYELPSKKAPVKNESQEDAGPAAVKLKILSDMKVCVAFDLMRVRVGDMGQMEKFTPALLKLFAEEDKGEDKGDESLADDAAADGGGKQKGKGKKGKGKQK